MWSLISERPRSHRDRLTAHPARPCQGVVGVLWFPLSMAHLVRLVTLLLVFVLTPGAAEIVENVAHLAADGHLAHAVDDDDHAPEGDEHGCSATMHLCACHSAPCFLLADGGADLPFPPAARLAVNDGDLARLTPGHALGVYRPPAV